MPCEKKYEKSLIDVLFPLFNAQYTPASHGAPGSRGLTAFRMMGLNQFPSSSILQ